ncbi:myosin light chain kinase 2, skeletal/cardiac muscle-like [Erpetoichthys calabaricus]|uniref:myosin light chain kinase 2, skeletal/cardiac muscle-like n=1 Tax=Erpetoichthys calabaricus TaxID=27687 RepID=UPI002234169C|nr:myosin light chain kinase 2, skeletal/cardiac muscle-like [Erpetoichthys calabaricus]
MGTVKKLTVMHKPPEGLSSVEVKLDCLHRKVDRLLLGQQKQPGKVEEPERREALDFDGPQVTSQTAPWQCGCRQNWQEMTKVMTALISSWEGQSQRLEALEKVVLGMHGSLKALETKLQRPGKTRGAAQTPQLRPLKKKEENTKSHEKEGKPLCERRIMKSQDIKDERTQLATHSKTHVTQEASLPNDVESKSSPRKGTQGVIFNHTEAQPSKEGGTQNETKVSTTKQLCEGTTNPTMHDKDGLTELRKTTEKTVGSKEGAGFKDMTQGTRDKKSPPEDNSGQHGSLMTLKHKEHLTNSSCENLDPATLVWIDSPGLRHVHSCPESLQSYELRRSVLDPNAAASQVMSIISPEVTAKTPDCLVTTNALIAERMRPHTPIEIRVTLAEPKGEDVPQKGSACVKVIDDSPPPAASFEHRFVTISSGLPSTLFHINTKELLGGGRFGTVHRCTEKSSGMKMAAKLIKFRNAKDKEVINNEVQVMNQLSHPNVIQLYDAYEVKNEIILIMEYVDGGELFDRIIDDSYHLTEVDAMLFIKQICEGIHYMHQMYVLHLDLKPENILCVNRTGHQVKIIDFGLARRYKPREKLRVSFGTPEFLAPEIVNFDFVSFPTDLWTLGVISYMLLSGLSPFLGDNDSQTLSNVLSVNWYFDEEAFEHVSEEAKDFISNLLIKEKSGRLSAAQCLKHPWLNNIAEKAKSNNMCLKSQILLKKYLARRLWKKNYIAIAAANRFKKISSVDSLTSLAM